MPERSKGYWFSLENGTHVHVGEGETPKEATEKVIGKTSEPKDAEKGKSSDKVMDKKERKASEEDKPLESKSGSDLSKKMIEKAGNENKPEPLHIASLEKQVSENPKYQNMVDMIGKNLSDNEKDAYFYAFKDAYEKSENYNKFHYMSDDEIGNSLSDAYYQQMDEYQQSRGLSDKQMASYGEAEFIDKYGTEQDFKKNGMNAWNKYMNENYGGITEDHQSIGFMISKEKPKNKEELKQIIREWSGGIGDEESYNFYEEKLGFKNESKPFSYFKKP